MAAFKLFLKTHFHTELETTKNNYDNPKDVNFFYDCKNKNYFFDDSEIHKVNEFKISNNTTKKTQKINNFAINEDSIDVAVALVSNENNYNNKS